MTFIVVIDDWLPLEIKKDAHGDRMPREMAIIDYESCGTAIHFISDVSNSDGD